MTNPQTLSLSSILPFTRILSWKLNPSPLILSHQKKSLIPLRYHYLLQEAYSLPRRSSHRLTSRLLRQIHYRRAQQFLSLCLGDRGPSYVGSYFHSVLRRGDSGEGLAGGDYEGKAGKGGAAIMEGIEGQQEVAKRCEKGMVREEHGGRKSNNKKRDG